MTESGARDSCFLNVKAHQLGWLKPINLKLRRLTKLRHLATKKLTKILLTSYYKSPLPAPLEKNKICSVVHYQNHKLQNVKKNTVV